MENFNILLVNYIIHVFQQIGIAVKSNQQMFFCIIIKYIILFIIQYSVPDIGFSHPMFERRWNKLDYNSHKENLA
jgi:hypothetical protein